MTTTTRPRGICRGCGSSTALRADGRVRWHGTRDATCAGVGRLPRRGLVPLTCLQGAHTETCGHLEPPTADEIDHALILEDGLEPAGSQLRLPVTTAVDVPLGVAEIRDHDGNVLTTVNLDTRDIVTSRGYITEHDMAEAAGFAKPTELTTDERRRVIAAHTVLDPGQALEVARQLITERLNP